VAGCDAHNAGGNNNAGVDRVVLWALGGAAAGVLAGLLAGFGISWALLFAAIAGAAFGFFEGSAIEWFRRLKEQTPRTITMAGNVKCAGRNGFGLQPWTDGDWTTNFGQLTLAAPTDLPITAPGAVTQVDEVRTRPAPGSGLTQAFKSYNDDAHTVDILHCEISANQGSYSVVGGAIGSGAGLGLGIAAGLAICAAAGLFTFGIGAALCALIVAILAAIGAAGGGAVGDAVGALVGWIVDELSDFDKLGKTIESHENCTIFITGRWVTDISHEHNEIHDIEAVSYVSCQPAVVDPGLHLLTGTTAIGRTPQGGNPPVTK